MAVYRFGTSSASGSSPPAGTAGCMDSLIGMESALVRFSGQLGRCVTASPRPCGGRRRCWPRGHLLIEDLPGRGRHGCRGAGGRSAGSSSAPSLRPFCRRYLGVRSGTRSASSRQAGPLLRPHRAADRQPTRRRPVELLEAIRARFPRPRYPRCRHRSVLAPTPPRVQCSPPAGISLEPFLSGSASGIPGPTTKGDPAHRAACRPEPRLGAGRRRGAGAAASLEVAHRGLVPTTAWPWWRPRARRRSHSRVSPRGSLAAAARGAGGALRGPTPRADDVRLAVAALAPRLIA